MLVTGATGFVGGAIARRLSADPAFQPRAAVRRAGAILPPDVERILVESLDARTSWRAALDGVDAVVHAAARVHVMHDDAVAPFAEFRRVNVDGTVNLARQAAEAGVRRFVFISSIKVNGECTPADQPFTSEDRPRPADPYGISKLEAEQGLREVARLTGLEVVVLRPVLVYGPGVGANFRSMLGWLHRGLPLPFGAVRNRRSLVALDNLTDLAVRTLTHPAAANGTFLVSDGEDLSTPELLRRAAAALGTSARLVSVPPAMLTMVARLAGRQALLRRLGGSLCVDISQTRASLDWSPPVRVDDALAATARHYLEHPTA